ncbi:MAG: hypothetical protein PHH14_01670 [Candidatus Margulisbacteria bacterium]|nr:hypothetical protein [Candidatus Margulisiibacteriota bacterium]
MDEYERYLKRLKRVKPKFDDGHLFTKIETKIRRERARRLELVLGGPLMVFLVAFVVYFNISPYLTNSGENMAQYVFQRNSLNSNQVMNYVYLD